MMRMMIVMICILITAGRQSAHGSQNELDEVDDLTEGVPEDFAAYQRELARTFAQVPPPAKKELKPEVTTSTSTHSLRLMLHNGSMGMSNI